MKMKMVEVVLDTVVMVAWCLKNDARYSMVWRHPTVVSGYVADGGRAAAADMVMVGEEKN